MRFLKPGTVTFGKSRIVASIAIHYERLNDATVET